MAAYSLSVRAAADLEGNSGLDQARTYLLGLHERFESLGEQRISGPRAGELAAGLRRFE